MADAAVTIKIMPLGDSITFGYAPGMSDLDAMPGGYRPLLWRSLHDAGYPVDFVGSLSSGSAPGFDHDHEGHGGSRIDQLQVDLDSWIAAAHPDVILLIIGNNDLWPDDVYPGLAATAPDRLADMLAQIQEAAPDAVTLVGSIPEIRVYDMGRGNSQFDEGWRQRSIAYNAAIPGVVATRKAAGQAVEYVPMGAIEVADGAHPSPRGYERMARIWHAALVPVLDACFPDDSPNRIIVSAVPAGGGGGLNVTVTTRSSSNRILAIKPGSGHGARLASSIQINGTQATFLVKRNTSSASAHLPFTVVDLCGEWLTFVGGGAGSF